MYCVKTSEFRLVSLVVWTVVAFCSTSLLASEYYSDPARGSTNNVGSKDQPWPAFDQVIAKGLFTKLQPGDVLYLANGDHGKVEFGGDNSSPITITNEDGAVPHLDSLMLVSGKNWVIKGISVGRSSGVAASKGALVTIGKKGETSDITLKDCHIYGALDTDNWQANDWLTAPDGIALGRDTTRLNIENNYVHNVRFGIGFNATDSSCQGNIVSDFSGDGIRVTRDDAVISYNIIKNARLSSTDGDKNHDDAIQCFKLNGDPRPPRNLKVHHNFIYMREDPKQKFLAPFQGLGFFDGPVEQFVVESNVVATQHYNGISLYNAVDCKILKNVVFNPWKGKINPWLKLDNKPDRLPLTSGNEVRGNYAHSIEIAIDKKVRASDNHTVTSAVFDKHALALLAEIDTKFGEIHHLTKFHRFNKALLAHHTSPK